MKHERTKMILFISAGIFFLSAAGVFANQMFFDGGSRTISFGNVPLEARGDIVSLYPAPPDTLITSVNAQSGASPRGGGALFAKVAYLTKDGGYSFPNPTSKRCQSSTAYYCVFTFNLSAVPANVKGFRIYYSEHDSATPANYYPVGYSGTVLDSYFHYYSDVLLTELTGNQYNDGLSTNTTLISGIPKSSTAYSLRISAGGNSWITGGKFGLNTAFPSYLFDGVGYILRVGPLGSGSNGLVLQSTSNNAPFVVFSNYSGTKKFSVRSDNTALRIGTGDSSGFTESVQIDIGGNFIVPTPASKSNVYYTYDRTETATLPATSYKWAPCDQISALDECPREYVDPRGSAHWTAEQVDFVGSKIKIYKKRELSSARVVFDPTKDIYTTPTYTANTSGVIHDGGLQSGSTKFSFCAITYMMHDSGHSGACSVSYNNATDEWSVNATRDVNTGGQAACQVSCIRRPVPPLPLGSLVLGTHTETQCTTAGGSVVSEGVAGGKLCKLTGTSCPSGWTRYANWSTTRAGACSGRDNPDCNYTTSCNTGSHAFSNAGTESCSYYSESPVTTGQGRCSADRNTCTAAVTEVGCY